MSKIEGLKIIDPQAVAEKLEAVRNFLLPDVAEDMATNPRFTEAMWFLSWVSMPENYAGGLARFTEDFITECSAMIGPDSLIGKGERKLTVTEISQVHDDLPDVEAWQSSPWMEKLLSDFLDAHDGYVSSPEEKAELKALRCAELEKFSYRDLQAPCIEAARAKLATYFFKVCTDPAVRFIGQQDARVWNRYDNRLSRPALWYFPKLWDVFFDWLDIRAEKIRCRIAETSLSREVFRWLRLAQETRKGVMVVGNSRFGKSEAIQAFAEMSPGRVRIIETPPSSAEGDLLREIARALGITYKTSVTSFHALRTSIDFVLRQSGLMLIFDEAQFLFPSSGGRRTDPPRLNYVRRSIMDLNLPTAFVCTPQSWKRVEKNYLKATGFTIEQFEGRLLRSAVILPDELPRDEMIEVARIHFPDHSDPTLEYIVKLVRAFQGSMLSCIENIARLANIYAQEGGRKAVKFADIKQAVHDVLPSRVAACPQDDASTEEPPSDHEDRPQVSRRIVQPSSPAQSVPGLLTARSRIPAEALAAD